MCEVNAFGCRLQVVIHPPSLHPAFSRPLLPTCRHRRVGLFYPARRFRSDSTLRPVPDTSSADNLGPMLLLLDWDKVMGQGDGRGTARGACFRFRFCSGCLSLSISREKSCPPVVSEIKSDRLCRKVLRMNLPAESVTFHAMGANQIFLKVYVVAALWSLSSISSKRTSCVPVNCSIRKVP